MNLFAQRIALSKIFGLIIGTIGYVALAQIAPTLPSLTHWGVLLWYLTFGTLIGCFGSMKTFQYTKNFSITLPTWIRGGLMGGWLNFVVSFFAYESMQHVLNNLGITYSPMLLFTLEGIVLGILLDLFLTKLTGEGKDLF